ncbi:MAG: SDR family oxidoreductase [bacterium]
MQGEQGKAPGGARLLEQKTALICGVASEKSIAWAVVRTLHEHGARIAMACMPSLERRVTRLAETVGGALVIPCDVRNDDDITRAADRAAEFGGGRLDVLVHSVAYAELDDLGGEFVVVSRKGWQTALDISAYSLVAFSRAARPHMKAAGKGSIFTMTFLGSRFVTPGYNIMGVAKAALEASVRYLAYDLGPDGIRVNAISPGPVETPSSMVIEDFRASRDVVATCTPLLRNVEAEDVAGTALYLASDLSSGVTGAILPVDAGLHVLVPAAKRHRAAPPT